MTWSDIKNSIRKQLLSRDLKTPRVRLDALENIEKLMDKKVLIKPAFFLSMGKQAVLEYLGKKKKLNSAEKSIINHVYDLLNGNPIPTRRSYKK